MDASFLQDEKPSNTEILAELMNKDKLKFISRLNSRNIKGLCRLSYKMQRLENPNRDPVEIHNKVIEDYIVLKCSEITSKRMNRAEQIVDAIKHNNDKQEDETLASTLER